MGDIVYLENMFISWPTQSMTVKFYLEKERNQSNIKPDQKTTKGHKVRDRKF